MIVEKMKKDQSKEVIEKFGLFDANTANYNNYYPDVTAEDLAPKEEDFINPTFRALSEVIVHKEWNPVDFGVGDVLKKSMNLLMGATVNVDHEFAVGNAIGAVNSVFWSESYKDKGIPVPAGINAKLKIDGKSNPKLARGVMMDPPSIHSTSVTVQFLWDKSHPELSGEEFFSKVGSFDKDGKLIRRIATKVKRYHEISLVSHGADPYAQLVKEQKIINPVWGNVSYNSVQPSHKKAQSYFFFDYQTNLISNEEYTPEKFTIPTESNNNSQQQNKKSGMKRSQLIMLAAIIGLTFPKAAEGANDAETDATQEELNQYQTKLAEVMNLNNTQAQTLQENQTELTRLRGIETKYNTESASFAASTALQTFKDNATKKLRDKVKASYTKLKGSEALAEVTAMIENGSFEVLTALDMQYTKELDEKFPASCAKCGSTQISRASAKVGGKKEGIEENGDFNTKFKKKLSTSGLGSMHEEIKD